MEFVANYQEKGPSKRIERVDRTQAHPGYQVYDSRRVVDPEWNKLFGGGKAQIAYYSMGKMSVRLGGLWRQGRPICGVRVTNCGPHPARRHARDCIASISRVWRIISGCPDQRKTLSTTHPNATQPPFLLPPQHATKTSYRFCGNSNVRRWSARRPPLHRSTLFLVECPIVALASLRNSIIIYSRWEEGRTHRITIP